ncbi:MAG: YwbE family protein [Mariniphaga sp.]|nr:YwbE family protein [Mariniphaga sp.]
MGNNIPDGRSRRNIEIGDLVEIIQKQDQRSGELAEGFVKRILSKSLNHPHGIKVLLETGEVGRIKNILEE